MDKSKVNSLIFITLITILVAYLIFNHQQGLHHDDAYITYNYAKNFASGHGLVFNLDQKIWGYTSPLQTIILSLFIWLGFNPVNVGITLSLFCIIASAIIIYNLSLIVIKSSLPASLIAIFFLVGGLNFYSYLGLETSLLFLLQLCSLLCCYQGSAKTAALTLSLSCLARPDSIVFSLLLFLVTPKLRSKLNLLIFFLPGLLWLSFAYYYYGSILPNSFHAKLATNSFSTYLWDGLTYMLSMQLTGSFASSLTELNYGKIISSAILSFILLFSLIFGFLRNKDKLYLAAYIIYPFLLVACYALIGAPLSNLWEVYSGFSFYALGALLGLILTIQSIKEIKSRTKIFIIAIIFLFIHTYNFQVMYKYLLTAQADFWRGARHQAYQEVAHWMMEHLPPKSSIAMPEVGTIGYLTQSKFNIIDFFCIITKPGVVSDRCSFTEEIDHYKPDYVLYWNNHFSEKVKTASKYTVLKHFPNKNFFHLFILGRTN